MTIYYALHGDTPETRIIVPFNSLDDAKAWCFRRTEMLHESWKIIDEDGKSVQGFEMTE